MKASQEDRRERYLFKINGEKFVFMLGVNTKSLLYYYWGEGMAQWWERSLPTNVSRVRFPDPALYVGWVCCWFSTLLWEVFLWVLRFSPLLKKNPNISKFQFDSGMHGHFWKSSCELLGAPLVNKLHFFYIWIKQILKTFKSFGSFLEPFKASNTIMSISELSFRKMINQCLTGHKSLLIIIMMEIKASHWTNYFLC